MKKIFSEFKGSLKDIFAEEAVDLFLFRPVSFFMAKFLVRLPVTPNQISVLSLISGVISGIFFSSGDRKGFFYGGIFYLLCHLFDLLDGMIARMKKNGTPLGRIIDGWVDYITSIAVYVGFIIGLFNGKFDLPFGPWPLMIGASVSLALHSGVVDYHRQQYLAGTTGKSNTISEDLRKFHRRFNHIRGKKGNYIEKLLLFVYFGYTRIQVSGTMEKKKKKRNRIPAKSRLLLVFWNLIGVATHRFFLILAAFLYDPMIFFYYILLFSNLLLVILYIIQWFADKKTESAGA